jgi:hypothetical protein
MADDSIQADDEGMLPIEPRKRSPVPRPVDRDDDDYDGPDFRTQQPDDGGLSTLIPYKNGRALAAYYIGVFSLIPIAGLILGPLALLFGALGILYVRKNPTAKGTAHAVVGLILGAMTTVANYGCIAFVVLTALANRHN